MGAPTCRKGPGLAQDADSLITVHATDRTIVPIPRILHQIWIGPRQPPLAWTRTWKDMNPGFVYRLWDEEAIEAFGLRNLEVYRRFVSEGLYDGAADIARAEILHRHGGVYADADSVALRPLGDAPFMDAGFFAQHEPNEHVPGLVTNAFLGAIPHHPVLERYIDVMSRIATLRPMWRVSGPGALTDVLTARMEPDVMILPWHTFFTATLWSDDEPTGDPYAQHYWSTTAERWNYEKATPYPTSPPTAS